MIICLYSIGLYWINSNRIIIENGSEFRFGRTRWIGTKSLGNFTEADEYLIKRVTIFVCDQSTVWYLYFCTNIWIEFSLECSIAQFIFLVRRTYYCTDLSSSIFASSAVAAPVDAVSISNNFWLLSTSTLSIILFFMLIDCSFSMFTISILLKHVLWQFLTWMAQINNGKYDC